MLPVSNVISLSNYRKTREEQEQNVEKKYQLKNIIKKDNLKELYDLRSNIYEIKEGVFVDTDTFNNYLNYDMISLLDDEGSILFLEFLLDGVLNNEQKIQYKIINMCDIEINCIVDKDTKGIFINNTDLALLEEVIANKSLSRIKEINK